MAALDLSGVRPLEQPTLPTAFDYAQNIASQNANNFLKTAQGVGAANDVTDKQRAMQLSMLSGVLNEPDPEKQREMISNVVPIANKLNPSYQLDPNIDVPTIRALVQSQVPIEKQAEMQQQLLTGMGTPPQGGTGIFPNQTNPTPYGVQPGAAPGGAPAPGGDATTPGTAPAAPIGRNEAYLSTLPAAIGAHVKAISDGNEQLPTGTEAKDPFWRAVSTAVFNYDPNFSSSKALLRKNTETNFASGKGYNDTININSVAGHLYDLNDASTRTQNPPNTSPLLNDLGRHMTTALGTPGTQGIENYQAIVNRAAPELAKFYGGGESTDASRAKAGEDFDVDLPQDDIQNNVKTQIGLLKSKAAALQTEADRGMNGTGNIQILQPKTQALMADMEGKPLTEAQKAIVNAHRAESNLPPKSWPDDNAATQAQDKMQPSGKTMIDTPEAVGQALQSGKINEEQARKLWSSMGYK